MMFTSETLAPVGINYRQKFDHYRNEKHADYQSSERNQKLILIFTTNPAEMSGDLVFLTLALQIERLSYNGIIYYKKVCFFLVSQMKQCPKHK